MTHEPTKIINHPETVSHQESEVINEPKSSTNRSHQPTEAINQSH